METLLTHWITEYGYWATFFGTMIEGETAAFLSGIAASVIILSESDAGGRTGRNYQ